MGLRETIHDAARAGFTAVGNIVETIVYQTIAKGAYDPHAGETWGNTSASYNVPAIIEGYNAIEIDGSAIRANDSKATILQDDLPVEPDTDGRVIRGGHTYRVIGVEADPAGAIWIMQLRTA